MKIIKKLTEQMYEELEGAEEYIKCAMKNKTEHKELSELYYKMSNAELEHAIELHKHAEIIIKQVNLEKQNNEFINLMKEIWDEKHECLIKEMAEIKNMIELYKTS